MEIQEFLAQIRTEVHAEISERLATTGTAYPYPELVFSEIVMKHMDDVGMTFEPQVCHLDTRITNSNIRLTGYSVSDDGERLDLFVAIFKNLEDVQTLPDSQTQQAAKHCLQFLKLAAEGRMTRALDPSHDAYELATYIQKGYADFQEVRIYVLTDGQAKAKNFKPQQVAGKTIRVEVMDIERLNRHLSEGKPRDELVVNFEEIAGGSLPCVYIAGQENGYDLAMTVFPGEVLRHLYDKFGSRLLEANVRSFLSVTGKVNKGIQATLRSEPEKFVAYNNGIVVVADEARLGESAMGGPGIAWLKGMQIVNGGQTTATIYFTKKKYADTDIARIQVPAKVIVLKADNPAAEESLISDISRYANSQNTVRQSDLSANKPFHVELEKLSNAVYLSDGVGRWFYERAAGSYNTMLAREGRTPARFRHLKTAVVPPSRRLTKTDLAKFLTAWDGRPDVASLGGQKNFMHFMDNVRDREERGETIIDGPEGFRTMIAKVILFKQVNALVRPMFRANQGNVAIYLMSMISKAYGDRIDLRKVWDQQGVSGNLKEQVRIWANEVHAALVAMADGGLISEKAKKPECWDQIQKMRLSELAVQIPEIAASRRQ